MFIKNVTQSNILFDHFSFGYAFTVVFFQQTSAMLQHLLELHDLFLPRYCIDDGRVGPVQKVLSSTSQRFSIGLRSEICGAQFMLKIMSYTP